MIKYLSLAFLLSLSILSFGQNITLDQGLAIRLKSIGSLEEYLTAKNWQLLEAHEETDSTRGVVSFAYKKSMYDDTAEAFISSYYNLGAPNRLKIQINRHLAYNAYMLRLKALGFRLFDSRIKDNSIIKIFKNKTTVIEIETSSTVNDNLITKTMYLFLITNRLDYETNFE